MRALPPAARLYVGSVIAIVVAGNGYLIGGNIESIRPHGREAALRRRDQPHARGRSIERGIRAAVAVVVTWHGNVADGAERQRHRLVVAAARCQRVPDASGRLEHRRIRLRITVEVAGYR